MLLITSECRIPAGLTRISPSTSSYLLPSLGVFRRSWRVAGTLVVIIVIVTPPPFHRLGTLHVHFPGEAYNGDAPDRRFIAPSKAWERGIPCERMKPFERIQLVKVQSG